MYNNINYNKIVRDILNDREFNKLKNIEHHGTTRFDHSLKVSYYSYIVSKLLRLDYVATARAGLLHDFFLSNEIRNFKDKFISTFVHPKKSLKNSKDKFRINEKEADIIISHMFPIYKAVPKYAESWIVSSVDKIVGISEFSNKFSYMFNKKFKYATNLFMLIILNLIRK